MRTLLLYIAILACYTLSSGLAKAGTQLAAAPITSPNPTTLAYQKAATDQYVAAKVLLAGSDKLLLMRLISKRAKKITRRNRAFSETCFYVNPVPADLSAAACSREVFLVQRSYSCLLMLYCTLRI